MAIRKTAKPRPTACADRGVGLRTLHVLLVQADAGEAAWTLRRIIGTSVPAEVVRAATLPDAVAKLCQQTFDAVFLDLDIAADPESCRRLIGASERPVVALARRDEPARLREALSAGVAGYYFKRPSVKGVFRRRRAASGGDATLGAQLAALSPTVGEARAQD